MLSISKIPMLMIIRWLNNNIKNNREQADLSLAAIRFDANNFKLEVELGCHR